MEEPFLEAGGDIDEVSVSLRVSGDELDPDWVTRLLGLEPSFAARKGDTHTSRGRQLVQRTGVWSIDLQGSREWVLHEAITALLARLPKDLGVWRSLSERAQVEVLCGLHLEAWNRGAELPASVITQLAERGLALDFDIYANLRGDE